MVKIVSTVGVIVVAIIGIVFLAVVSDNVSQKPSISPQPTNDIKTTIDGTITNISQNAKTIVVKHNGTPYTLTLMEQAKIVDKDKNPLSFSDLQRGFSIQATGKQSTKSVFVIETITVTSQPNILLYSPDPQTSVGRQFLVSGIARVFENVVSLRILDNKGKIILSTTAVSDAPDIGKYGPFTTTLTLPSTLQNKETITLEVFQASAKDGSPQDVVRIPLVFEQKKQLVVKVFFINDNLTPATDCETVFPVEREIPYTQTVARAAVSELLKGPTEEEVVKGYGTAINDNVAINSLTIKDGVAHIDFDESIQKNIGGSCRVLAIRSQITQTLKQFPSVSDVVISVNKRTEDILQP